MIEIALLFLFIAVVAAIFGFGGIAGAAASGGFVAVSSQPEVDRVKRETIRRKAQATEVVS